MGEEQTLQSIGENLSQVIESGNAAQLFTQFGVGCLVLLISMFVAVIMIRRLAKVLIWTVAGLGCFSLLTLLLSQQVKSWPEIIVACVTIGLTCGILAIPALTLTGKD